MTQGFLTVRAKIPCPFCGEFVLEIIGGEATDVERGDYIGPAKTRGPWVFCAGCSFCGACGPQCAGETRAGAEALAIDAWNSRVAS